MADGWSARLEQAGFALQADGPGTWVLAGPQWVRAVITQAALVLEAPVGRLQASEEALVQLAQHGQVWGLGRLFHAADQGIAQVSLPCWSPDEVSPDEIRALHAHLVEALPVLLEFGVPAPIPGAPMSEPEVEALLSALQLHAQRHGPRWLVPIDTEGARYALWITLDGPSVRLDAVPEAQPRRPEAVLLNHLNQATSLGSVAPSTQGPLAWTYAIPAAWLRGRPERLRTCVDHALEELTRLAALPPVREGIMLPRLVPATEVAADSTATALVPGDPRSPRVVVVPADAETLEVIPVIPSHPWSLPQATAALAEHVVPWARDGGVLRCRAPFAAEQVLLEPVLIDAHQLLGAPTLAVAVPHRGHLLAAVDADVLAPYLEGATLCAHVLWVQEGRILGLG